MNKISWLYLVALFFPSIYFPGGLFFFFSVSSFHCAKLFYLLLFLLLVIGSFLALDWQFLAGLFVTRGFDVVRVDVFVRVYHVRLVLAPVHLVGRMFFFLFFLGIRLRVVGVGAVGKMG